MPRPNPSPDYLAQAQSNSQMVLLKEYRLNWCSFYLYDDTGSNNYRVISFGKRRYQKINDFTGYSQALEFILDQSSFME